MNSGHSERPSSIQRRVRAVILLASTVVLFVSAAAFVTYEAVSFRTRLVRSVSTLAGVIADNSIAPLVFDNRQVAQEILAALRVEPDIEAAVLFDDEGNVFATYPRDIDASLLPRVTGSKKYEFKDGGLIVFEGVVQEGKTVGSLYLRNSLRGLYEQLWRYAAIVAIVLLGAFGAAFVLSNFLQRRISQPILALSRAAETITQRGDYSVRAAKSTDDEIGLLTDSFNRMVAETQDSQERLSEQARLLELSSDAIIVRELEGRILFWNSGAEELYGWPRAEALGKNKNQLLKTVFSEPLEEIHAKLLRDGRWSGELTQTRRDGRRIYVSTRWVFDPETSNRPARVLITDNDITLQKQAEDLMRSEAKRLDALVEQRTATLRETIGELEAFSYSISHDMRAPLRAMQGYSQALLSDYAQSLDAEAKHYLDRIFRASNRLDLLIQDVLAYSRMSKGDIDLHPVELGQLLDDIIATTPEFQGKVTIEGPLDQVLGHEAYLTQCLSNLLSNAIKFVQPDTAPRVRVWTERLDGAVRVWFEDNGIGIDPSHQDRIFQMFGQVHPEKKYGGTGIGLAIVRKAVQRMSGEVGVESELGKGSRFWLLLGEVNHGNNKSDNLAGRGQ